VSIPAAEFRGSRAGRYGTGQRAVSGGMDPDMKRMALFAGGIATVLAVLFAASALMRHRGSEVPVIAAAPGPIRVKPENPGGMKIDAAESDLFSGGADTGAAKLSPPAETPDTTALRAGAQPAAPLPVASAMPAPPKPAAVASAAKPAVATAAPPPSAKPAAAPAGKAMVQLAALESQDAARAQWHLLSKKMPDILGGREPSYSKTEHDGKVFWRVRTSGFADVAQARIFCDRVRAKGGSCSVADF
jgi:hypothetical protein